MRKKREEKFIEKNNKECTGAIDQISLFKQI